VALMLGQLYDALRAGNVPDDKARAAAEEVANYEGEIGKLRLEVGEVKSDVRLLKSMMGFVLALQVANFFLQLR
jgi:phage shock protein A